ncbi:MAG: YlxM family DNA-binding protein [Thermaerobacter sp.]|nr:YlxM family DNA-binding protein [Thermaerobacter sp.]
MEHFVRANLLLDFYGQLLTARQVLACRLYYEENFSLAEIADELAISRQGVHDTVRRAERQLELYESKLALVARFLEQQQELRRLKELVLSGHTDEALSLIEKLTY